MKEVKVTMYEAKDGRLFNTSANCIEYEKNLTENMKAKQKFNDLIDFCEKRIRMPYGGSSNCANKDCPFYYETYPHNCLFGFRLCRKLNKLEI